MKLKYALARCNVVTRKRIVMDITYTKIITTIGLTILGWLIAHYFTSKRNTNNKRRELATEYLINAYRILTNDIAQRERDKEINIRFENILSDIQLFGTREHINLAKQLIQEITDGESGDLDPLINSLRNELRLELSLDSIEGNIRWIRFESSTPQTNKSN